MFSYGRLTMNFERPLLLATGCKRLQIRGARATVMISLAAMLWAAGGALAIDSGAIAAAMRAPFDNFYVGRPSRPPGLGGRNAPSPSKAFFGVNTNRTRKTPDLLADWLGELGVGFARQGLSMSGVNPKCLPVSRAANWSWFAFDDRLDQYKKRNIKVVLIALQYGAPTCATLGNADPFALMDSPQRYADYVEAITRHAVSRYPGGVIAVELGNEPDSPGFWRTKGAYKHRRHNADAYFAYMAPAARAAARVRSETRQPFAVLNGGYANSGQDLEWWRSLLSQPGFGSLVDGLNVHIYPWAGVSAAQQAPGSNDIRMIDREAAIARAAHLGNKPFWITEIGVQASATCRWGVSEQRQAELLKGILEKFATSSAPKVSGIAWFTIQDDLADRRAAANGDCYAIQGLGLIDDEGRKRPSFFMYKDIIAKSARKADTGAK